MKAYENVYSLESGKLIKNKENKIEYNDKNGKRRVKTNPTYEDFAEVGKFVLSSEAKETLESGRDVKYFERNGEIYPIEGEVIK